METVYSFQVHSFLPLGANRCQNLPGHIIIPAQPAVCCRGLCRRSRWNAKQILFSYRCTVRKEEGQGVKPGNVT